MDARQPLLRRRRIDVDPVEQRFERALIDYHAGGARVVRGEPEIPGVEAFVEDHHSRAVEEKYFQRSPMLSEKDEERAGPRIAPDALFDDAGQARRAIIASALGPKELDSKTG